MEDFLSTVKRIVRHDSGIKNTLKFDLKGEGFVHVDATQIPNVVSTEDLPANCTIRLSLKNAEKLLAGELNPMTAMMTGKVSVKGEMGVAMQVMQLVNKRN
jgi:putative sterol carrier protein